MTWLTWLAPSDQGQFTLRPATADDGYLLADIVMAATKAQGRWPAMTAPEQDRWRDRFADWSRRVVEDADPGNVLAAIQDGEHVIGRLRVVRGSAEDAYLQLAGIQLLPSRQGRGIGTAIIRGLQDAARREGVLLLIGVEKDNVEALRLYERLGCVPIGEDGDEYQLRWTSDESAEPGTD